MYRISRPQTKRPRKPKGATRRTSTSCYNCRITHLKGFWKVKRSLMTTYQGQLATLTLPEFGLPSVEPAIPARVYRKRMASFRQRVQADGYDVAIVYGDREHFANLTYLTGYDPRFEEAM